ncbi:MAG: hypothetical protein RMK75_04060 [Aquificaceae bacterium]|nr:hypothetical protein [Aquificaceae bacterium]MDW8066091.1 hypothetical protein [Aquificaceae bacterium]MDW8423482.1 hypothetical protein [Aquificaceae bacterium]
MLWKIQTVLTLKLSSGKHKQSENPEDKKIFWQSFLDREEEKPIQRSLRVQFEELYYGVVYTLWFTYGSMHEAKAYRVRKVKSAKF